jgi:S-adenosylmethionine-diacylgycerolhomoserine-N-methlytransferase
MIPDWYAAVANAEAMLRPGGIIGVVDFYVSRKYPGDGMSRHGWPTRTFWPAWFSIDNVFLSPDHVPLLQQRFETVALSEDRSRIPYLPFGRVPYYVFLGRKPIAPRVGCCSLRR